MLAQVDPIAQTQTTEKAKCSATAFIRSKCGREAPGGAPQGLQQAGFRKGEGVSFTDDEMVQNANVHQFENRFQAAGDRLVGMARLGQARGMVVGEDDRCAVVLDHTLEDRARIHTGAIDGAVEQRCSSI